MQIPNIFKPISLKDGGIGIYAIRVAASSLSNNTNNLALEIFRLEIGNISCSHVRCEIRYLLSNFIT